MFFWGGFNFASNSQAPVEGTTLPYPAYLPPSLAMTEDYHRQQQQQQQQHNSASASSPLNASPAGMLESVCGAPPASVRLLSAGLKHCLVVVNPPAASSSSPGGGGGGTIDASRGIPPPPSPPPPPPMMYALGSNHYFQLSRQVPGTHADTFTRISYDKVFQGGVRAVCCGARFSLLLTDTGSVFGCGDNAYGQLGLTAAECRPFRGLAPRTGAGDGGGGGGGGAASSSSAGVKGSHHSAGGGGGGGAGGPTADRERQDGLVVADWTLLASLPHVSGLFTGGGGAGNSVFAVNLKGDVYSWGDAQPGHLGHGEHDYNVGTNRDQTDVINASEYPDRLMRCVCQRVPRRVDFFHEHRLRVEFISVGKSHFLAKTFPVGHQAGGSRVAGAAGGNAAYASSATGASAASAGLHQHLYAAAGGGPSLVPGGDVYACGDGAYGKLGGGDTRYQGLPVRVRFPGDEQDASEGGAAAAEEERVTALAAGDDYSVVIRENRRAGSVVYYFGRVGSHDAQPVPTVLTFFALPLTRQVRWVWGGRGRQACMLVGDRAQEEEGEGEGAPSDANNAFYVWGKSAVTGLHNGTLRGDALAGGKEAPQPLELLNQRYANLNRFAFGGTFIVAGSDRLAPRVAAEAAAHTPAATGEKLPTWNGASATKSEGREVKLEEGENEAVTRGENEEAEGPADIPNATTTTTTSGCITGDTPHTNNNNNTNNTTCGTSNSVAAGVVANSHAYDVIVSHDARIAALSAAQRKTAKQLYANITDGSVVAAYDSIVFHDGAVDFALEDDRTGSKKGDSDTAAKRPSNVRGGGGSGNNTSENEENEEAAEGGRHTARSTAEVTAEHMQAFSYERAVYALLRQYYSAADEEWRDRTSAAAHSASATSVTAERLTLPFPPPPPPGVPPGAVASAITPSAVTPKSLSEAYMRGIAIAAAPLARNRNDMYRYLLDILRSQQQQQQERMAAAAAAAAGGAGAGEVGGQSELCAAASAAAARLTPGTKRRVRDLRVGDKVRLWMTDVYALGTVTRSCQPPPQQQRPSRDPSAGGLPSNHRNNSSGNSMHSSVPNAQGGPATVPSAGSFSQALASPLEGGADSRSQPQAQPQPPSPSPRPLASPSASARRTPSPRPRSSSQQQQHQQTAIHQQQQQQQQQQKPPQRVTIQWLREDWNEEEVSLYTDDETFDSDNDNRWQPIWFEKQWANPAPAADGSDAALIAGEYVFERNRTSASAK